MQQEFILWGRRDSGVWLKLTNNTSHAEMERRRKDGWEVMRVLKGEHPEGVQSGKQETASR